VDDALHAFTLMTIGRVPSVILCVLVAAGIIWSVLVQSRNARRRAGMDDGGRFVSDSVPVLLLLALLAWAAIAYQGIPMPAVVVAVLAVVLGLIARHTFYGRRLYAIGDNPESARRVGVNVKAYVFFLFLGMGVIYSLDGIMLAARLNGAPPDPALFLELNAITAVIIGGTSLFGGIGTVRGTLLGAILLGSLANGMQLAGVSTYLQFVVQGLVLVGAVALDTVLKKRRVRG
jgi:D-xylose transport system permease protein